MYGDFRKEKDELDKKTERYAGLPADISHAKIILVQAKERARQLDEQIHKIL